MSDNKAPVRVWCDERTGFKSDKSGARWAFVRDFSEDGGEMFVSAAALRELVEKWEKLNEKLHLQYPHDYAGYYYDAAQELEQLLEA